MPVPCSLLKTYFGNRQILIVLSSLPLAKVCPSGLMATEVTTLECPVRVRLTCPVERFQILSVLSALPLAKVCPSGLMATELTELECPVRVRLTCPVERFQILSVSPLPLAKVCPSGLMATIKPSGDLQRGCVSLARWRDSRF